jgi:predicted transcriptional regulator
MIVTNSKLTSKEKEILRQSLTPKTYTWLNTNVVKNPTHLSNLLAQLCERGYLVKKRSPRGYQTTQEGHNFLSENAGAEEAVTASLRQHLNVPLAVELPKGMKKPDRSFSADYGSVAFLTPDRQVMIEGFAYMDDAHERKFNEIIEEFKRKGGLDCIASLFRVLSEAVSSVYGYEGVGSEVWGDNPFRYKEMLMHAKAGLDFDAGFVLRFDGRSVSGEVPWGELLKVAVEGERRDERGWRRVKRAILKPGEFRLAWLEEVVRLELEHKLVQMRLAQESGLVARGREELEESFVEEVRGQREKFPRASGFGRRSRYRVPGEGEVRGVLRGLEEEGVFRIVERCVLEIDPEKLDAVRSRFNELFEAMNGSVG